MKKVIGIAAVIGGLMLSTAVFADQPIPPPGNSAPGEARYDSNPGRQQAGAVGAQCDSGAGSGAFGWLGKDNNMGINSDPTDPGANGYQTGLNNSGVCGNRQGNL